MATIKTYMPCCGFIDMAFSVRCPYPGPKCRIHANGRYSIRFKKESPKMPNCAVCCCNSKTTWFKCGKHAYCDDCIMQEDVLDGTFDDCPFCASEMEMLD